MKECLQENYPDVDWNYLPDPTDAIKQPFNINFWLNPKDPFTKSQGYYRLRMLVNACHHSPDADVDNGIYDFSGAIVLKEIYQVNNQGNNTSFIYTGQLNEEGQEINNGQSDVGIIPAVTNDLFTKRYDDGSLVENDLGDPVWDPAKWVVVDYYFNVAGNDEGVDENGDATTPVRIKITTDAQNMNNHAVLIKDFSLTKYDEKLTQEVYDLNKESFATVIAAPGAYNPDAGVEGIIDNSNAPVEYYNLQGVKVSNPENGIFIKKQGKTTSKIML